MFVAASVCLAAPALAGAAIFSNPAPITINNSSDKCVGTAAAPYPSTISVLGPGGTITDVNVTLTGLSHPFPADVAVLLVGP